MTHESWVIPSGRGQKQTFSPGNKMLLHKRFVTFSGMSGAQAAAEASEATAEILVESYLVRVKSSDLTFDKNGTTTLFLLIPQRDGRGKLSQGFSVFLPLCLRMVRDKHCFFLAIIFHPSRSGSFRFCWFLAGFWAGDVKHFDKQMVQQVDESLMYSFCRNYGSWK